MSGPLVGVLGGGQLGRMLALAGIPLGVRFRFLDPNPHAPARDVGDHIVADYADPAALERFAAGLAAATFEFENVPVTAVERLAALLPPGAVQPGVASLAGTQDRVAEKELCRSLGIPTAPFAPVDSRAELDAAAATLGLPAILKTRRMGYDGKGQAALMAPGDAAKAWDRLGGQPLVLEGFVPFARECSLLAVRGRDGAAVCYPLVENHHESGILRWSLAPAPGAAAMQAAAERHARRLMDRLGHVGCFTVELFEASDGLVVNELAPRVHNSGHWTIDGAATSQFENHVRALLGWPLGPTTIHGSAAMVNAIGVLPDPAAALAIPGAKLHLYGKEPRPGRKVAHLNLVGLSEDALRRSLTAALDLLPRQ